MLLLLKRWLISSSCKTFVLFLSVVCFFIVSSESQVLATAGINRQINFQGKVVNKTVGTNVTNGNYDFTFKIYDSASGGVLIWTENYNTTNGNQLTVTDGIFRAALGSVCTFSGGSCQGNTNTAVDFNSDSLYLDITFNSETMGTRVRFTAVPYALNAEKVSGLTVTNNGTNTLNIAAGLTLAVTTANKTLTGAGTQLSIANNVTFGAGSTGTITLGSNTDNLALATSGSTSLTLPTAGTLLTNTATANQTITSTQTTGTVFGVTDSTGISAATTGMAITLSGAGAFDQTGLQFNLSNATGTNLNDIVGTGSSWKVSKAGVLTVSSCSGCGAVSSLPWSSLAAPTGNTAFNMYQSVGTSFTTAITYGNATSTSNLFTLQDTSSNTGTGYLLNLTTAGSSTLKPLHVTSAGVEAINVDASGNVNIGTVTSAAKLTISDTSNTNPAFSIVNNTVTTLGAGGTTTGIFDVSSTTINTGNLMTMEANALSSGRALSIASGATAMTGSLEEITLSGSGASNTGSLLKLSNTGTSNANTTLYIDHRATGTNNLAMRIDDASGDTTPVIVDGDGRVGIGTTSVTGTTERLLQVGSATNRGNAAIYGDVVTKGFRQIEALTNIKDVFVYDTSLDSDGGKWIDWSDTEKLSWFTETLDDSPSVTCDPSTMDRCYSDAFPRKAILVVTTSALYIFDGTNGQMWMKFSQNAAGWALGADTNNDPSSVTAMNGVVYVGANGSSAGGLYVFDFINDRMWNIDGTDRSGADVGIGSRNGAVTYGSDNNTNFDIATVGTVADWGKINDVSVTVLKNSGSAIAAATGPNNGTTLVGLATDSGLTVINLSTQKVTQFSDVADNDYNAVVVTPNARLYGLNEALGQAEMWMNIDYGENVATRVAGTPDRVWDEASTPPLSKSAPTIIAGAPDALDVIPNGSLADQGVLATAAAPSNSDLIYVGTNQGLTEIDDHQTAADGWSKFYTVTRQTPYMIGAIRRMHMMNDASGNITNDAKASIMTAKNTPTYGVEGVRGKAMSFNGTNQFLCSDANSDGTCDNDTTDNMSTGGWTISMWFKHSATISGTDVLFSRCYNTTPAAAAGCVAAAMTSGGLMGITVDFDATFTIGAATNNTVYHQSVQTFNDNQWHFLAITRAATTGNVNTMIDGKPIGQTAGVNTTLDASQILSIGANCSVGVACATGANFWDGSVDDFQYSAIGATTATSNVTTTAALHRLYNDARPLLNNKVITVTDATTASSSTIGDSGEAWIPQEFAGRIVTLTGGTGSGQTRRIVSNTATVLTVSPVFATTPDTTTDFKIDSEALYGSSNSVTAIGVTKAVPLGEARIMCAGTNDAADGGGVTCFNHQSGPNLVADIFHSGAKYLDDAGVEWTGTNYDNIQSIDMTNRTLVIATGAHTWTETQDVRLGNAMDYFQGKVTDIRNQIQSMGTTTLAGMIGTEIGLSGGADLAENYQSATELKPGQLVAIDPSKATGILVTSSEYQKNMLGVIATRPGLTLGGQDDNSYPVALTGRVPVIVTTSNGRILSGDPITSSTIAGVGMRGALAGTAVGMALEDSTHWDATTCSEVSAIDEIVWPEDDGTNSSQPCFRIVKEGENDTYIGKLMVFMHPGFYQGDEIIATKPVTTSASITVLRGLAGDQATPQEELTMNTAGEFIITNSEGKEVAKVDKDGNMQITSITGLPKLSLTDITGLDSYTKRLDALEEKVASLSAFPTLMTASAAVLGASDAAQLAPLHTSDPVLSFDTTTDATISGKLRVQGSSLFEDIVTIVDTLTTKNLVVSGFSTFFDDVLFKNTVTFSGRPVFNADTVGFVTIKKGEKTASVTYLKPYETMPVVMAQFVINKAKTEQEQKTIEDKVFSVAPHYVISRQSAEGFTILLDKEATEDTQFSWTAFSQK